MLTFIQVVIICLIELIGTSGKGVGEGGSTSHYKVLMQTKQYWFAKAFFFLMDGLYYYFSCSMPVGLQISCSAETPCEENQHTTLRK